MVDNTTQAGRETWTYVCAIVAHVLPKVATITQIKAAVDVAFQVGADFPPSRVDEVARRRCGWATKAAFENRAQQLGLVPPESPWKLEPRPQGDNNALIANLRSAQATLYARHGDGTHPEILALEQAIARICRDRS